jgi:hypothetical protein
VDHIVIGPTSCAVSAAIVAAVAWAPVTGYPTWNALTRGRFAVTAAISAAIATLAFMTAQRLATLGAG